MLFINNKSPLNRGTATIPLLFFSHEKVYTHFTLLKLWFVYCSMLQIRHSGLYASECVRKLFEIVTAWHIPGGEGSGMAGDCGGMLPSVPVCVGCGGVAGIWYKGVRNKWREYEQGAKMQKVSSVGVCPCVRGLRRRGWDLGA